MLSLITRFSVRWRLFLLAGFAAVALLASAGLQAQTSVGNTRRCEEDLLLNLANPAGFDRHRVEALMASDRLESDNAAGTRLAAGCAPATAFRLHPLLRPPA